ncbi:MAG: ergothioneine biosynthesis protein EgtB [Burkholderiaceae bacterium]
MRRADSARRLDKVQLRAALRSARQYTRALVDDLTDAQWRDIAYQPIVNPFLWEVGHVGWFMEHWCVRWRGAEAPRAPSLLADVDRWYDSGKVAHPTRWTLDLPSREATLEYLQATLHAALDALERAEDSDAGLYFFRLALFHEDMHGEAFAYMRNTLGYPAPAVLCPPATPDGAGDAFVAGGVCELGLPRGAPGFVFDNEKWAHDVLLAPYAIARRCVTHGEFVAFVDDGGYARPALWSDDGRAWLARTGRAAPRGWRREGGRWHAERFGALLPLAAEEPVRHVTAHEAEAYCRWAKRRLPTEAEWENAAVLGAIEPSRAVWEWTATTFEPYPGFAPDPYADYSAPWFGTHRAVRGASFATSQRLVHPRFRNFYLPERDDIFVGFRTCALD